DSAGFLSSSDLVSARHRDTLEPAIGFHLASGAGHPEARLYVRWYFADAVDAALCRELAADPAVGFQHHAQFLDDDAAHRHEPDDAARRRAIAGAAWTGLQYQPRQSRPLHRRQEQGRSQERSRT